jgi:anthranilate synthase component 1
MPHLNPLSLGEVRRLTSSADTILLRATRQADLETPVGAFLRLDDGGPAYLLESVEGGEHVGRYSFLAFAPRRLLEVRAGMARTVTRRPAVDGFAADLPATSEPADDPLAALRSFLPRRRVVPQEGMPRFTGGAVGALAYDAAAAFEPVPLPERDPVGTPLAAFMESDLVLAFDHLTHSLSAIASLPTHGPDLEGRYRAAEGAILELLEKSGRGAAESPLLRGDEPVGPQGTASSKPRCGSASSSGITVAVGLSSLPGDTPPGLAPRPAAL